MSKFKPARATNLHADNWNPLFESPCKPSFAVGFDYDGARYHIWFRGFKPQDSTLFKNPPLGAMRGGANHFDTRRLDLAKPFGAAALSWILPQIGRLSDEARNAHEAECAERVAQQGARHSEQKIRDAAPALLAVVAGYSERVQAVLDAWTSGDLAGAVNLLEDYRDNEAATAIDQAAS